MLDPNTVDLEALKLGLYRCGCVFNEDEIIGIVTSPIDSIEAAKKVCMSGIRDDSEVYREASAKWLELSRQALESAGTMMEIGDVLMSAPPEGDKSLYETAMKNAVKMHTSFDRLVSYVQQMSRVYNHGSVVYTGSCLERMGELATSLDDWCLVSKIASSLHDQKMVDLANKKIVDLVGVTDDVKSIDDMAVLLGKVPAVATKRACARLPEMLAKINPDIASCQKWLKSANVTCKYELVLQEHVLKHLEGLLHKAIGEANDRASLEALRDSVTGTNGDAQRLFVTKMADYINVELQSANTFQALADIHRNMGDGNSSLKSDVWSRMKGMVNSLDEAKILYKCSGAGQQKTESYDMWLAMVTDYPSALELYRARSTEDSFLKLISYATEFEDLVEHWRRRDYHHRSDCGMAVFQRVLDTMPSSRHGLSAYQHHQNDDEAYRITSRMLDLASSKEDVFWIANTVTVVRKSKIDTMVNVALALARFYPKQQAVPANGPGAPAAVGLAEGA